MSPDEYQMMVKNKQNELLQAIANGKQADYPEAFNEQPYRPTTMRPELLKDLVKYCVNAYHMAQCTICNNYYIHIDGEHVHRVGCGCKGERTDEWGDNCHLPICSHCAVDIGDGNKEYWWPDGAPIDEDEE